MTKEQELALFKKFNNSFEKKQRHINSLMGEDINEYRDKEKGWSTLVETFIEKEPGVTVAEINRSQMENEIKKQVKNMEAYFKC